MMIELRLDAMPAMKSAIIHQHSSTNHESGIKIQ
jgi:hypothetical protein